MRKQKLPLALIAFLTCINILNFFDRYLVQAVEPLLKSHFALNNQQSGGLAAAFVVGYVIFSPLFGFFGDRADRRLLMAIGLISWSLFTGLTGLAGSFFVFLTARMLVGIGEASFGAIVPAYLKARVQNISTLNSALSIFYVAIPVGSALGYIAGGNLAAALGWQRLFLIATLPGLALSIGFLFLKRDAPVVIQRSERPSLLASLCTIAKAHTLRLTILGYILQVFALNGVAMYVVRHVTHIGAPAHEAAQSFGINLAITGFVGALGGGLLASKLMRRSTTPVKSSLLYLGITTIFGVPFLAAAFLTSDPGTFFKLCFVAQIALFAGTAPLNSVIVERAPSGMESFTQGVTIFCIQLFGAALAPLIIGGIADLLTDTMHLPEARSLTLALQLAPITMLLSGIVWLMAARGDR